MTMPAVIAKWVVESCEMEANKRFLPKVMVVGYDTRG